MYADNLEKIQRMSTLVDEDNIKQFLPQQPDAAPDPLAGTQEPQLLRGSNSPEDTEKA